MEMEALKKEVEHLKTEKARADEVMESFFQDGFYLARHKIQAMVRRASTVTAPPPRMGGSSFSFVVPVRFNVR